MYSRTRDSLWSIASTMALCVATFAVGVRAETISDNQLWTSVTVTGDINKDFAFLAQIQPRYQNDMRNLAQLIVVTPAIGWKASKKVTVWGGYVYTYVPPPREGARAFREHRLWQQVNVLLHQGDRNKLLSATRLEERMRTNAGGAGWRVRSLLSYAHRLGRSRMSPSVVVSVEPMVYLNSTAWGARKGFDQIRGYVGMSAPVTGQISVEAGYTPQYVDGHEQPDQFNHVAVIGLTMRL